MLYYHNVVTVRILVLPKMTVVTGLAIKNVILHASPGYVIAHGPLPVWLLGSGNTKQIFGFVECLPTI